MQTAIVRRSGHATLAGVLLFAAVCGAVQALRTDLHWLGAPLSFYLLGDYGALVKIAYVGLAVSLPLVGVGCRAALRPVARGLAPLLLFGLAGGALVVTALAHTDTQRGVHSLEGWIHARAALVTFVAVTCAMLWQSFQFRADPAWRARFWPAVALALLAFVALWTYALWREPPRGLMQKTTIVLILVWLAQVGAWLVQTGREAAGAAQSPPPPPLS
jgi:hypothetical protein